MEELKGFIEVQEVNSKEYDLISVESILRVINTTPVLLITKELVSHYECSNSSFQIYVNESYEEIKQLIKNAQ